MLSTMANAGVGRGIFGQKANAHSSRNHHQNPIFPLAAKASFDVDAALAAQLGQIVSVWGVEGQFDIVRATFTDGTNVPRIPPMRAGGGVFYRDGNWLARVSLIHAFPQNDIAANETPTDGYNLLKAELSYTQKIRNARPLEPREFTVGIVCNNLLNEDIRNSVSYTKNEVLLPEASVRGFVNVKF